MSSTRHCERAITVLKSAVRTSDVTQARIERALGMSKGYLSQIFSGRIELKLWHLEVILDEIGFEPQTFFRMAYPQRGEEQAMPGMEQFAAYASRRVGAPEPRPERLRLADDLRAAVREMVHEALAEEKAASPGEAPRPAAKAAKVKKAAAARAGTRARDERRSPRST